MPKKGDLIPSQSIACHKKFHCKLSWSISEFSEVEGSGSDCTWGIILLQNVLVSLQAEIYDSRFSLFLWILLLYHPTGCSRRRITGLFLQCLRAPNFDTKCTISVYCSWESKVTWCYVILYLLTEPTNHKCRIDLLQGSILPPYNSGTTATLTCNIGSTPIGTTISTCTNGVWNPPVLGQCPMNGR